MNFNFITLLVLERAIFKLRGTIYEIKEIKHKIKKNSELQYYLVALTFVFEKRCRVHLVMASVYFHVRGN